MSVLEQYAYSNRLRCVHPGEKIFFALATLIFLLATSQAKIYIIVLVVISVLLIGVAGIPTAFYLRLLLWPLSFLITSGAVIAVTFTPGSSPDLLFSLPLGKLTLGVTRGGLLVATKTCLKALASVSCLYFLALTTPMLEITTVLRRLRVPGLVLDLLTLVYRFSSVLLDTAIKMYISQSSRLGYSSLSRSFRSLGYLISNLFLKTHEQARMLDITLASRGYQGEFRVLEQSFRLSRRNLIFIGLWFLALGALAWFGGGGKFALYIGY